MIPLRLPLLRPGAIFIKMIRLYSQSRNFFLLLLAILLSSALPVHAVDLPEKAPIPEQRQQAQGEDGTRRPANESWQELPREAPIPEERPSPPQMEEQATKEEKEEQAKPEDKTRKPESSKSSEPAAVEAGTGLREALHEREAAAPPEIPPPLSAKGKACRRDLKALGVAFTEDDPVESDEGCAIPHPLSITTLGAEITIEPAAELNCMMARTLADFMQHVVQPAAKRHFAQPVKVLHHASAFVCRPRNGTKTLSEHAFGNALDISAFVLSDGSEVAVKAYDPEDHDTLDQAMFLNEVRAAACGPFTTVLGPGSNADHETHFHFDLKERGNRYKVCE